MVLLLQVTLQCLTPREKFRYALKGSSSYYLISILLESIDLFHIFRAQESRERYSQIKNADNHDVAVESNESDHSYVQSVESPSIKDLDSSSSSLEVESRVRLQIPPFENICYVAQLCIGFFLYVY